MATLILRAAAAAREEAFEAARDLLAEMLRTGQIVGDRRFEIEDEHGSLLDVVRFRHAMKLPASHGTLSDQETDFVVD